MFILLSALALAVPQQLSQQGRLLEADGTPLEGAQNLTIHLFESPIAIAPVWGESISVLFTNGYYAVILGSDPANMLDSSLLSIEPLYLELQINNDAPLQPRQKLNSAPYARHAGVAENVSGGSVDAATISISGTLVIDSSGSWVGPTMALNWSNLAGTPAGFADGIDDDTKLSESEVESFVSNDPIDLALGSSVDTQLIVTQSEPCGDGELLLFDLGSAAWVCGQDSDTTLSAEQIKNILAQNIVDLAAGSTIGGEELLSPSSSVEWSQLTNVPNGLDDGDDQGLNIQCAEGEILTYSGGTWICSPFNTVIDADGDGALTWNDCDDSDPSIGNQSLDQDCDGALSGDDCDDNDPSSTIIAEDADCDGAIKAAAGGDDCDDNNDSLGAQSGDVDCDGLLTADDCDDNDDSMPNNDADCDGYATSDDCDDNDSSMPSGDADCDGLLTADDCDDNDDSMPNNDADCDGYATADDCDDSDPLAYNSNGISEACAAYSCLELLSQGLSTGNGTYWINPSGNSALQATCDMTTEGGGYTYYAIDSGISTSSVTDNNSCKQLGMDIVYPRSRDHWSSIRNRYDSSYFEAIPGVYKSSDGGNYTGCAMNSSGCSDWRVADGGRWWLRSSTYSEPNGDYTSNCWLDTRDVDNIDDITFNDGYCSTSTSRYLCSTNDKP